MEPESTSFGLFVLGLLLYGSFDDDVPLNYVNVQVVNLRLLTAYRTQKWKPINIYQI